MGSTWGATPAWNKFFFKLARGFWRRAVVLISMAILAPSLYDGAALG